MIKPYIVFGVTLTDNLLDNHTDEQWLDLIKDAEALIKERIKIEKLPENIEIHKKEYFFAGCRKMKMWMEF